MPLFIYESIFLHSFKNYNYSHSSFKEITEFIRECDEENKFKFYNSQKKLEERRKEEKLVFSDRIQKIVSDELDNIVQTRTPFLV